MSRALFLVLLLATIAAPGVRAAATPPATPVARLAGAWVAAFNSGDPDTLAAFYEQNVTAEDLAAHPVAARLAAYRQMRGEIGHIRPLEVVRESTDLVELLAVSDTDERLRITLRVHPGDPPRLASLAIEGADDDADGPPVAEGPPLSEAALVDSIAALLGRQAAAGEFSGAVLLVAGDRTVFRGAVGLAERRFDVPNTAGTKFNIGSISKLFTKCAIAQLLRDGRLRLDDPVARHLPDYPAAVASRITIGQLVDHSSGLGDIFGPGYDAMDRSQLRTVGDYLPLFRDQPLRFEPGTDHYYSNAGYTLLGAIIERISGLSYDDYMRRNIFAPLGMMDTGSLDVAHPPARLATGYTRRPRAMTDPAPAGEPAWEVIANTYTLPGLSGPAGGGYSTADDLVRFARALRDDRILPRAYAEWLLGGPAPAVSPAASPVPSAGAPPWPEGAAVGVAGGTRGVNAVLEFDLHAGVTLVVLANQDPPSAESTARTIRGWVRRAGLTGGR